jgi:hypothetical protein
MCNVLFCLIVTEYPNYALMYSFYCLDERCTVLQCYLLQFFDHLGKVPTLLIGLIVVIFFRSKERRSKWDVTCISKYMETLERQED